MEELFMLRRMLVGGLAFGAVAVAYQLIRGLLSEAEPLWDASLTLVLVLTGVAGGWFDFRRTRRSTPD